MENTEHLGLKIAALRKEKGCTQAELGAHLNISAQAVSKWERGESCPDFDTLCKIASFFEVPITYFERGQTETEPVKEPVKESEVVVVPVAAPEKKMLGVCKTCGKVVYEGEEGRTVPVLVCRRCVVLEKKAAEDRARAEKERKEREREEAKRKALQKQAQIRRSRNRGFIWGGIIATVLLVLSIIGATEEPKEEIFSAIMLSILSAGLTFLFVTQLFWDGAVFECATIGGKIVGTPGIIFTFDLDGFLFLIGMKILFAIIRFIIYVATLLFFVLIAYIIAPFTFIPALIRVNKGDLVY